MGFWSTLFPSDSRRSRPPAKKRRTNSLRDASLDRLTESFAQASIARKALSQSTSSATRQSTIPQSPRGGLYRQEIPSPRSGHPRPSASVDLPAKEWQPSHTALSQSLPRSASASTAHYGPIASPRPPMLRPVSEPPVLAPPSSSASRPPVKPAAPSRAVVKPNQCRGTTSNGRRCTRIVAPSSMPTSPSKDKKPPTSPTSAGNVTQLNRVLSRRANRGPRGRTADSDSDASEGDDNDELPKFCHQHAKSAMEEPGTFAGARGVWVLFNEWIPAALPQEMRLQLRYEMARPPTRGDKPGYLYVHEMARMSSASSPLTHIKIGRSVKPVARLSQWRSQCPSRTPIVRGLFPRPVGRDAATLGGALAVNPIPTPYHHRWERLVLIEVAGRAQLVNGGKVKEGKCVDCGRQHCEVFSVERGAYERYIIDIIQRWQQWCERIL